MILPDVNVLVYAHRQDVPRHEEFRAWLEELLKGSSTYGMSDLVLSGFLRIVTHPKVFQDPTPLPQALAFAAAVRERENRVSVQPGPRHWTIFQRLCVTVQPRGNLIPDAYLAAMAIEAGAEFVTTDRDYSRFPELRTRHPLD